MSVQSSSPIKIGERTYTVDIRNMIRRPLESMRQMVDQSPEPGEQSFDNRGIWKRTQDDFVLGANQRYFDQTQESSRRRHRTSRGAKMLDNRRELTNQPTFEKKVSRSGTYSGSGTPDPFGKIIRTPSNYIVWLPRTGIFKTASHTSFTLTQITGITPNTSDLAYWNGYAYATNGSNLYRFAATASTVGSTWAAANALIEIAAGRMIVSDGATGLYEIANNGDSSTIYLHPDAAFGWSAIAGASNGIYVAGSSGDFGTKAVVGTNIRTEIYLITVVDATGALAPPYPVAELPANEVVMAMKSFGNLLILGTSQGVRIARISNSGYLDYGPLIETGMCRTVWCAGRFAYFAMENVGVDSAIGIGKLALDKFTEPLVPAYSADLTTTEYPGGYVLSMVGDSNNLPVVLMMNSAKTECGIFARHATTYETAKYWSGGITYGTPERKAVVSIEGVWEPLPTGASVQIDLLDGINGTSYGGIYNATPGSTSDKATPNLPLEVEEFEVKVTLTPSSTQSVTLRRWTARSIIMPFKSEEILLPIMLHSLLENENGQQIQQDVRDEWDYLFGLSQSRTRIDFTLGSRTVKAYVDGISVEPSDTTGWTDWDQQNQWPEGTIFVRLITFDEGI